MMCRIAQGLRTWWEHYLQMSMGTLETAAGLLEYVDANTINLVGSFLGPKWGPLVSKGLQCGAGILTAYRAYQARRKRDGR